MNLPLLSNKSDDIKIILGWSPIFLKHEIMEQGQAFISENFIGGPGKNMNNEKVLECVIGPDEK